MGAMRSFWKVFAALALMLPLGAFVAGNLVASAADDPAPRDTIIIDAERYAVRRPVAEPRRPTGTPSASADARRDRRPRRRPATTTATTTGSTR